MKNSPKRILLANGAHIGDLILSSAVLPVLKKAFPECEIGFLCSSWASHVMTNHTLVDAVHIYDHPSLNRAPLSPREKREIGQKTWKKALKELREKNYDCALDLYTYYKSTSLSLLFRADIPLRIGYWGTLAPYFLTRPIFWDWNGNHMVENHGKMLLGLEIEESYLSHLFPTLTYTTPLAETWPLPFPPPEEGYLLIHIGVGEKKRAWAQKNWEKLITLLSTLKLPLFFIGKGKEEKQLANLLSTLSSYAVNFVDTLSWYSLLPLIKKTKLLIGLESMAGHVAAALHTPSLLLYGKNCPNHICRWRPYNPLSHVLTPSRKDLEINSITPEEVFRKACSLLETQEAFAKDSGRAVGRRDFCNTS